MRRPIYETCLFCGGIQKHYKPGPNVEFVCGACVQLLLAAGQEDLKRAYAKAINLNSERQAKAIKIFITLEVFDEQQKPESKKCGRYSNRAGIVKSVRNQKERIKRVAA